MLPQLLIGGGGDVGRNDFGVEGGRDAAHFSEVLGVEGLDSVKVLAVLTPCHRQSSGQGRRCKYGASSEWGVLCGAKNGEVCRSASWLSFLLDPFLERTTPRYVAYSTSFTISPCWL